MSTLNQLETIMQKKGQPSLKAFAGVFGLNPVRLYTVAKQPKEGEVYDRNVFNWDAVMRFCEKRLDADAGLATMEDVVLKALAVDEQLKTEDGRKAANRGLGIKKTVEVDGKLIAERKYTNFEIDANKPVVLKKDPNVYKIVLQTKSHTVLRPINNKGEFVAETVNVISNGMLNFKGSGPATIDQDIKERLDGSFLAKMAAEAAKAAEKAQA